MPRMLLRLKIDGRLIQNFSALIQIMILRLLLFTGTLLINPHCLVLLPCQSRESLRFDLVSLHMNGVRQQLLLFLQHLFHPLPAEIDVRILMLDIELPGAGFHWFVSLPPV